MCLGLNVAEGNKAKTSLTVEGTIRFEPRENAKIFYSDLATSLMKNHQLHLTQPAITCSKLTIETLEQGVKYVQS